MIEHGYAPKCKKIAMNKLAVGPKGHATPLCQSCIHQNCGNPIEYFTVSIYGINQKLRLFNSAGTPMAVIDCEGYSKKQ